MSSAFGETRTLPATREAKKQMKQLVTKDYFNEQRDVWTLGAALGIALGKTYERGKRETFQNVNSLDPDGIFSAILFGLYPDANPKERAKKLVDHAEWGIREIFRREQNGTLDFSKLCEYSSLAKKLKSESPTLEESKTPQFDARQMIENGEDEKIEFKSSMCWDYDEGKRNKLMEFMIAKTVSAFMNSNGGYLLIGIGDNKKILGLDKDFAVLKKASTDTFELHFTNIVNKYLGKENRPYVKIWFEDLDDKKIAVVVVPSRSPNPVYVKSEGKEEFYIRLGNSSHPLNVRQAATYIKANFARGQGG